MVEQETQHPFLISTTCIDAYTYTCMHQNSFNLHAGRKHGLGWSAWWWHWSKETGRGTSPPPQAAWVSDLTGVTAVGWVVAYFGSHEKVLKEGRENNTMKIAFEAREMARGVLGKCSSLAWLDSSGVGAVDWAGKRLQFCEPRGQAIRCSARCSCWKLSDAVNCFS